MRGLDFDLLPGEALGIVGESGSGKSAALSSLLRLTPNAIIERGSALFEGQDLLQLGEKQLRSIRGQKIGMIFQDPMSSLNPTLRIGDQIAEALLYHNITTKKGAYQRTLELLDLVGIPDPARVLRAFPHELSGGMRQRAAIAVAVACRPTVLIAD